MSLANITLTGTIKKDAEQKTTANGNSVVNFMMNVLRYDNRAKEEKAYPVKVSIWGDNAADQLVDLKANARVFVTGRLQIDQFQDKNGQNVKLLAIEANRVDLISSVANASSAALSSATDESFESAASSNELDGQEVPF